MVGSVNAKCPKCGRMSDADSFVIDYIEKKAICPACVRGRGKIVFEDPIFKKEGSGAGIIVDEEGVKIPVRKSLSTVEVEQKEPKKCRCVRCGYRFNFDPKSRKPRKCDYCGTTIDEF